MNGRLQLIEQKLIAIDPGAFQNLCDTYLALRANELISFNRTGSQFGKQKTVKGTPDTFLRLSDGSLRFVEYTTTDKGLVDKIKKDIDSCLNTIKTGISQNEIHKIIICFNSRLDVPEETEITKYAASKNIRIELIGLDWLALEIYSKYLILAKDFLGISLDTGQLLPLQNFIDEYNNKAGKLSTPLDNEFLHRKNELDNIESVLTNNDILIVSGLPGIGKTKIALEAFSKFLSINKDYSAYTVSKKDMDISEDLRIHLQQEQNYILLIDDANRQLVNFKQILGVFKEKRKGNIKLLITVRNYALNDIKNECFEFDPYEVVINKFTDDEITELINSESFEIRNHKYQKKIVELADGNARLAVMSARLAKQQHEFFLYGDVSDLYDSYFQTFIKDFDIFGNKKLLKTLGIISFFFSIDRSNKKFIERVLRDFEIEYHEFNEAIDELEKRELVEVQYNYARISDQVMSTYFFYKVFIKDEILSFKTLLFNYYFNWKKRFSDTIIPSNNSFGYDNVFKKINATLDEFLNSILKEEQKVLEFFSLFWFYKRVETLNYFYNKIKELSEPASPLYITNYETNDFVNKRDRVLDFISDFFYHYDEYFIQSLELAFEYCRKKSELLPELIRRIREKIMFNEKDERIGFMRQVELFNLLIKKSKERQVHYIEAFFALSKTFLSHHFKITESGRKHTIISYQYPLPITEVTKNFRKKIWEALFENYDDFPNSVFDIIKNFRPEYPGWIQEILEFDLSLILPFIETKLNPNEFAHTHFVNDFLMWLDKRNLTNRNYKKLRSKFYNKEYEYYRIFDWNRRGGKEDYEYEKYEDFEKLKEHDIRSTFIYKNKDDFKLLHKTIQNTISVGEEKSWGINQTLNIIVDENFLLDNELGFHLFGSLLNNYPKGLNPLYRPIKIITEKSEDWAARLWNLFKSWNHEFKIYWQLAFFEYLPKEFVNDFYKNELLDTINMIDKRCYLQFESFEKFIPFDKKIIQKILKIVVDKIENKKINIQLSFNFFENFSKKLEKEFVLLSKAYIQQEEIGSHFDFTHEGLKILIQIKPKFLLEYLTHFYTDKNRYNRKIHDNLSFMWDLENNENLIEEAVNLLIENNSYYEHSLNILFNHLNEHQKMKAQRFILKYISKYNTDPNKMNAIFDVIRHSLKDFFEEAFIYYLSLNTNEKIFQKIWWRGNGGSYSGDVIIGEQQARDWQIILEIVQKCDNQLTLIPINTYIKKEIECKLRNAEWERARKFIEPEW